MKCVIIHSLIVLVVAMENRKAVAVQVIESVGEYSSVGFQWSTDIPMLSFSTSLDCTVYSFCRFTWFSSSTRVAVSDKINGSCANLVNYVSIQCNYEDNILYSTLNVSSQFDSPDIVELRLVISGEPTADGTTIKNITIKDCDSSSDGIKENINETMLGSYSYNEKVNGTCIEGFDGSVLMTCLADATWSGSGNCTKVTTTTQSTTTNASESGPNLSSGDAAGIAITFIQVLFDVGVIALVFVLQYAPMITPIIGLYIVGNCLGVTGILMCFLGSIGTEQSLNEVETAGVIIGSIGLATTLAGLLWHAIKGSEFEKGS